MIWLDRILGRAVDMAANEPETTLPTGEIAYSESLLYGGGSTWPKYNPDTLVGRKGLAVYQKMMTDEQVKAVVKFRRDSITARRYSFVIDDPDYPEAEAERRIGLYYQIVDEMEGSFVDALNRVMSGMQFGFSVTEKLFKQIEYDGASWWGIEALKLRPVDTFLFEVDPYGNILDLIQRMDGEEQSIPPEKVIHYVHNPDVDEHYGRSELREAYRSYFSKDMITRFWNIHLERHAGGFTVLEPKEGKNPRTGTQAYTDMTTAVKNISASTGFVLPADYGLRIEHPVKTDAFEKAIQHHNRSIARALLVPDLLGISDQGNTGSYSQAQTQLEAFLWSLDADADRLQESLNEQLFRQLGEINFGDGVYPKLKLAPISMALKQTIMTVWNELVTSGAVVPSETDEAHIRDVMDFPEKDEDAERVPVAPESPQEPGAEPTIEPGDAPETTIIGKKIVTVSAFARAKKRVNFNAIERDSDVATDKGVAAVGAIMGDYAAFLADMTRIDDTKTIVATSVPASYKRRIKNAGEKSMRAGWGIGTDNAGSEISLARGESFIRSASMEALSDVAAAKFIEGRAFTMAGNLTDQGLAITKNILQQGIKYSKSEAKMRKEIYEALASAGLISESAAKAELGEILGVANPDARIATVIRTNVFESVNEARFTFLNDPALDGFVEALEYDATMDSRTTPYCRSMNGKTYPVDSEFWDEHRPPGHYNCRSILISVTVRDEWEESESPKVEPAQGFG